jgi:hypothetical protein
MTLLTVQRQQKKAHMIRRLKRAGRGHQIVGEIADKELMTTDILKKRRYLYVLSSGV